MLARFDYLRLASWYPTAYPDLMAELMERYPENWEQAYWLQYHGWRHGSMFCGVGEQNHIRHTVFHVSGSQSEGIAEYLRKRSNFYASRVDLQVTIERPNDVSLPEVHARLGSKISTLISSELNDTLYIGKRTSDIFTRCYEKPIAKTMYLRLEFELKGDRARAAWDAYHAGETATSIYNYYKGKSILPMDVKEHFTLADDTITDKAMREEIISDSQKKLAWLRSIDSAVVQALCDHNISADVAVLVLGWSHIAQNIDRMDEES